MVCNSGRSFRLILPAIFALVATVSFAQSTSNAASAVTPMQQRVISESASTQKTGDELRVTSGGGEVHLNVGQPAPLNRVMTAICVQQKIKCTGTEGLAAFRVPEMSVDGTLRQVVSGLLEGTGVNYSFTRTRQGVTSQIDFLGKAPHGSAAVSPASADVHHADAQPATADAQPATTKKPMTLQEAMGKKSDDNSNQQGGADSSISTAGYSDGQTGNITPSDQSSKGTSPFPAAPPIVQPTLIPGEEFPIITTTDKVQRNGSAIPGSPSNDPKLRTAWPSPFPPPSNSTAQPH